MKDIFIVGGYRTPFCKFNTVLADEELALLGASPTKALIAELNINSSYIDEVVFGCCNQPVDTLGNIARTIALRSGIPEEIPAVSVHRNCASGFEAITYAYDKMKADKGDIFVVGGVESMSQAPFTFSRGSTKKFTALARSKTAIQKVKSLCGFRPKDFAPQVSLKMALTDKLYDINMGETAELVSRRYNITREEQDMFAVKSHTKAAESINKLKKQIAPYYTTKNNCLPGHDGKVITEDNGIRIDANYKALSKLRPVFERGGTVTAGNSSQVTDGGAVLILMTEDGLNKTGCTPIVQIADYAYSGCDPKAMGLGPVHALAKMLPQDELGSMELVEINEAFAAQALACQKILDIPDEKLNVSGGAIALGHPLAASGARLAINLMNELVDRDLNQGVATLCVGGGQGGALWLKQS